MQNRQLIFSPRKPYDLVAEPRTRTSSVRDKLRWATALCLQFPVWWSLYDKVRTFFEQNLD